MTLSGTFRALPTAALHIAGPHPPVQLLYAATTRRLHPACQTRKARSTTSPSAFIITHEVDRMDWMRACVMRSSVKDTARPNAWTSTASTPNALKEGKAYPCYCSPEESMPAQERWERTRPIDQVLGLAPVPADAGLRSTPWMRPDIVHLFRALTSRTSSSTT